MGQTNPDLEARILANPNDRDAYLVYGDWLSERGDPRGELVAVQMKLDGSSDDKALAERADKIIEANRAEWLGDLAGLDPKKDFAVTWRWGFVDSVRIGPPTHAYATSELDFPDTYRKVLALPHGDFIRDVIFGARDYDDYPTSWAGCVEAVAEAVPKLLRRLEFTRGGYWDISSTELGNLSGIYRNCGKLEELSIELGSMTLGDIDLPALQKLEIVTGGLTSADVHAIATAVWPALESLSLCIGESGNDYGCDVEFSDLEPLLVAERMPKLSHLGLANSNHADEIAAALPKSRVLPRLVSLDLSRGTMGDDGAQAILDNWNAFAHLKSLDLSNGYFSDGMIEKLQAVAARGTTIVLDDLEGASDPEDRYCRISE